MRRQPMPRGATVLFAGVIVLVIGVLVAGMGAAAGVGLVVIGAVMLSAFYLYAGAQARRTTGWTRVVNPGAAYREARAEREALARREADAAAANQDESDD
jgi:Flp pilus assembly protein TadB